MSFQASDPNEVYELVELLGEGSYGSVYKARNKVTSTEVAIKILPDSGDDLNSLKQEIEFLKRLSSPYGKLAGQASCVSYTDITLSLSPCRLVSGVVHRELHVRVGAVGA